MIHLFFIVVLSFDVLFDWRRDFRIYVDYSCLVWKRIAEQRNDLAGGADIVVGDGAQIPGVVRLDLQASI